MLDSSRDTLNATRDYEYSIQVNRWFLTPMGAWPRVTETSRAQQLLAKLLRLTCHSLMISSIVPCILFILFEDTSLEERMKSIGPMSHFLMGELNYCCLLAKANDILYCVEQVKQDWRNVKKPVHRDLMLKNAKLGRSIACIAAFCMHTGVGSDEIVTGLRMSTFYVGNESYSMYPLPCTFYTKLMDTRFSPTNEIMFVLQCLSGFIVNSVTVGACGLGAVLAMHACGQLNVVMSKLDDLVDAKGQEERVAQRKLGFIVEHHLRTLSFIRNIENVMNLICLVELVGCTLNMCMLEYYLLTEKSKEKLASYVIVYVSMTFNIFIFCYIGETLTEQCTKVGEKVYMTEWYRLPHKTALGLVMIISRSSMVIKITAGKFLQMSVATFGDVFKASFAYFNMIRTVAM
ncbi:PREDICTED: odorant receptor 4-like [Habropoda laboriosa]|uniref:odorant receptor 4-like n=1 Tax=Habropoda laboriosa TaxID=597456 RepID=UPI00083DBEF5|nr:PREDICTED: odorant receptor 4-like [Habropoda laboriosa]